MTPTSGWPKYNLSMGSIFLVGFMGCGKTTVGRELADRLGWLFVDLDETISRSEGRSIPDIFEDGGEAAFRVAERRALEDVVSTKHIVIATGGGLFQAFENRRTIADSGGWSVFLDVPWSVLEKRVGTMDQGRPMWKSPVARQGLFENRLATYRMADAVVQVRSGQTPKEVAEEIILMRPELQCVI